jgi:hypothetical protein
MTKQIFKYPFKIEDEITMMLPAGANVLYVGVQSGIPCMWTMVEINRPTTTRKFRVFGTGHLIPWGDSEPMLNYIGTFQQSLFVWHVFEQV